MSGDICIIPLPPLSHLRRFRHESLVKKRQFTKILPRCRVMRAEARCYAMSLIFYSRGVLSNLMRDGQGKKKQDFTHGKNIFPTDFRKRC